MIKGKNIKKMNYQNSCKSDESLNKRMINSRMKKWWNKRKNKNERKLKKERQNKKDRKNEINKMS